MRTAHLARVDGGRVRIATVDDVALAKSSSSSSAGTSRGTGTTGGTMMMTAGGRTPSGAADTSVSAGASRATLVTESTGVIGPAATASKGTSSLVTLSDADAWLLEAARFARLASIRGRRSRAWVGDGRPSRNRARQRRRVDRRRKRERRHRSRKLRGEDVIAGYPPRR